MPGLRSLKLSENFLLLTGLVAAMLVAALDGTMFGTALPTIVGELDGVSIMQWVTTIYLLASVIMLPVYGKLGDYFSRKWLFIGAMAVFLIGSVIGGLADSMTVLIVARGIQGVGAGGLMTLAFTILALRFSSVERMKYSGIMGSVFGLVSVIGPFIGGLLTDAHHIGSIGGFDITTGWRWAFWLNIPLGALAIVLLWFCLKRETPPAKRSKVDIIGIGLLTVISTVLVLASSWGGSRYEWDSWQIIGMAALAIGLITIFVIVEVRLEKRGGEPFLPMSMFKNRDFTLVTFAGVAVGVTMFGVIGYMPTYIQMVTGYKPSMSGLLTLPMMVCMLLVSVQLGRVIEKVEGFKYRWCPPAGTAIIVASLFLLGTMTIATPVWLLCGYLALMGIGLGLSMQLLMVIAQNSFPDSMTSTVTGVNQYFRQIGSTFGMSGVGSLFVSFLAAQFALNLPGVPLSGGGATLTPEAVQAMPPDIKNAVLTSYDEALTSVFHIIVWVAVAAVIMTLFLSGAPLRKTKREEAAIEALEIGGPGIGTITSGDQGEPDAMSQFKKYEGGKHRAVGKHRA